MNAPSHALGRRPSGRRWRQSALALLLIAAPSGVCTAQDRPQAALPGDSDNPIVAFEGAITEARAALQDGEPQVAESRYRSALLEGWLLLGTLAIENEDLAAAKAAFEEAASSATETRRPRTSLALVQLEIGETAEALDALRAIVLESPADAEARRLLSRALAASGRIDESLQELEQLRALAPDDLENTFALATAYLRHDRPQAAEALFAELAEKRPIPQTWVLIGRVQRDYGYYERARGSLEAALAMDPSVRRAHYYLGSIDLLDQGRGMLEEAMEHFAAELELVADDPMANLYLGIGLVESRRHEEAVPMLEIASRLPAAQRDAYQFLGRAYLALDRQDEAVTALSRALELAESEALEASDGIADLGESQLASLHYQLALALRRSGDEAGARVHFDASKKFSAQVAESSREILDRYLANETRETKSGSGPTLLGASPLGALAPEDRQQLEVRVSHALAQSYLNLGVLMMRGERHERAADLFEGAAGLDPEFPRIQYSLGVARFNAGQFERAGPPLTRALEENPTDANLRRMLALSRLNSAQYQEAAELLETDGERFSNPSLQYAYGLALVRSGRASEAEEVFGQLLTENADWPQLNVLVGQAHAQQDDFDTAIEFLHRALELDATVAEASGTLGDIYLRQGRLDEAETALRSELSAHPQDFRSLYTLAVVLDLNRNSEQALKVLEALLESNPRHANGRYLRGKILLAGGEVADALEELQAAAALAPEDANIRYQLGQAYQKSGRIEEAKREFEAFRQLKASGRGESEK